MVIREKIIHLKRTLVSYPDPLSKPYVFVAYPDPNLAVHLGWVRDQCTHLHMSRHMCCNVSFIINTFMPPFVTGTREYAVNQRFLNPVQHVTSSRTIAQLVGMHTHSPSLTGLASNR